MIPASPYLHVNTSGEVHMFFHKCESGKIPFGEDVCTEKKSNYRVMFTFIEVANVNQSHFFAHYTFKRKK